MNKTILFIGFIPIFALGGKILAQKFTDRRIFWEDFLLFINLLESEVNFSQKELSYIIKKLPNRQFLHYLELKLQNKTENSKFLSTVEVAVCEKFFSTLGKIDKFSQKDALLETKNYVKNFYEDSKKIEKQNATLYFKLGILLGILVFILFI